MASSRVSSSSSRGPSWSHEEILALIRVWSDQSIQDLLRRATRTADIYKKISEELELQAGHKRTPKQCKDKLKNLRQFYKDIKDGHEKSGYNSDNWPYFEMIDAVLGDRPATRPPVVVDTTLPSDSNGSDLHNSTSTSDNSRGDEDVPLPTAEDSGDEGDDLEEQDLEDTQEEQSSSGTAISNLRQQRSREPLSRSTPASKRQKKTGIERALSSFTESFLEHQMEMEERMMKMEDRRRKEDMDRMERMRKDDCDHELRLFQMLAMGQPMSSPPQFFMPSTHPPVSIAIPESQPVHSYPPVFPYSSTSTPPTPEQTDHSYMHTQ